MKKTLSFKKIIFNRWTAFIHDVLCIPVALFFSYWVRFNFETIPAPFTKTLLQLIFFALPVQGAIFWFFGLYRGFWRFASIPDLIRILKAVGVGTLIVTLVSGLLTRFAWIPRSVFVLYPIFLAGGLCGSRLIYRWFKDHRVALKRSSGKRTIIVGAGRAGEQLVRDLLQRPEYEPLAFLDDDKSLLNREIHGVRVAGTTRSLPALVKELKAELVILAIPSASREVVQQLVELCRRAQVTCLTLPSVHELSGEEVDAHRLRSVTVEDLLGREPVHLDTQAISGYLTGKTVLVTGGGGSIGSELCRQIAELQPRRLIVFDHGEFNLYSIDHELRSRFSDIILEVVLGDVRDVHRLEWVFDTFTPAVVFHAAAYKHVPMVENNPAEGIRNNALGTKNVADLASRHGAERFILVSTDKAVNPANVMGASKRVAEIYCQNLDRRSETSFITTRFGNVLGSAGSVVPLFRRQIENGGPVTVTHQDITRYFMTIPEAVGLILQAGAMGNGGEIFVLDMGKPVRIRDLAEHMIRLSGLEPGKDIKIVTIGLRPGEKLYEELLHEGEDLQPTPHDKLLLATSREIDWHWLLAKLHKLEQAATSRDLQLLEKSLHEIVPECTVRLTPANSVSCQSA